MAIKYEVHSIENAEGTGKDRKFVQLQTWKAKTIDDMADVISEAYTVTKADVMAVMTELSHFAVTELVQGFKVYLPDIGYLSLAAGSTPPELLPNGEITGKDIYLKKVSFQPETKFLKKIRRGVTFEKSKYSTLSVRYTDEQLWQKMEAYLSVNGFVTRRIMHDKFGLGDFMAKKWLEHFVESGKLVKVRIGCQQVFSLK